ncbi:MAG TPA: PEPxxWA-CTERM sorting domain-containing protein [Novosphingobium sp.]
MKKTTLAVLAAATSLVASPSFAATTIYTDQAAFLSALNASSLEDFADTTLATGLSFSSTVGSITSGRFADQLAPGAQTTTFNFATAVNAFGGNFDLSPGGAGIGIQFTTAPGGLIGTEVPRDFSGQFFGFISDTAFTSVLLTGGTQANGVETYNLDNLVFGTGAAVPEPGTWAMMIVGIGLAGGAMRRRATAKIRFA